VWAYPVLLLAPVVTTMMASVVVPSMVTVSAIAEAKIDSGTAPAVTTTEVAPSPVTIAAVMAPVAMSIGTPMHEFGRSFQALLRRHRTKRGRACWCA
jgi:hypothetical protein